MTTQSAFPFPGFPPEAQTFLANLRDHNERDWFNAHKSAYEDAIKGPAQTFLALLEPKLAALTGRPVSGKIFRIHRDVRFSKDKSPYNAHLHIAFPARSGASAVTACGFFFALEPERVLIGAGGFDFSGAVLDAYRAAAADPKKGAKLQAIFETLTKAGLRIDGAQLKRVPAPYPQDHPRSDLLRRKGLHVWRDIHDPKIVTDERLYNETCATFEVLTPLVRWLSDL